MEYVYGFLMFVLSTIGMSKLFLHPDDDHSAIMTVGGLLGVITTYWVGTGHPF
jgi:hypothetical protein